jgi:hypothetical protein
MAAQAEEMVAATWAACGGYGEPPPLIVSQTLYNNFVRVGVPARLLRLAGRLPISQKQSPISRKQARSSRPAWRAPYPGG